MKKTFLLLCVSVCYFTSHAQDTTLKEYIGTYLFPAGSHVPSADVTLKDTILTVNSVQGSSDLIKRSRDSFALVSYDGTASFTRDSTGKVSGIKVQVQDILMEGNKQMAEPASVAQPQPTAIPGSDRKNKKSNAKKKE